MEAINENEPLSTAMDQRLEQQNIQCDNTPSETDIQERGSTKKESYIKEEIAKLIDTTGIDIDSATKAVNSRSDHLLHDIEIVSSGFNNGKPITIGDLLDDGLRYDKRDLFGSMFVNHETGKTTQAKFHWKDGRPCIWSGGNEYKFKRIEDAKSKGKFRLISSKDLSSTPPKWLINDYLEEQTLATFFGMPASMKSFMVIDMGLHLVSGKDWHGHTVKQCPVAYIAGEGQRGIERRLAAWKNHYGSNIDNFYVSSIPAQILSSDSLKEIEKAVNDISKNGSKPELIIIDTLNRNFGDGDENSTIDMTKFIRGIDRLSHQLECAIIIVHHSGLGDTKRVRGSSALRGAMDFEYICEMRQDPLRNKLVTLSSTKTKDHEPPITKVFQPFIKELGIVDKDNKPITSVVLIESTERPSNGKQLPKAPRIALDALKTVIANGDASEDAWKVEAYGNDISASTTLDTKRKAFDRARKHLTDKGLITITNGVYSIV